MLSLLCSLIIIFDRWLERYLMINFDPKFSMVFILRIFLTVAIFVFIKIQAIVTIGCYTYILCPWSLLGAGWKSLGGRALGGLDLDTWNMFCTPWSITPWLESSLSPCSIFPCCFLGWRKRGYSNFDRRKAQDGGWIGSSFPESYCFIELQTSRFSTSTGSIDTRL